MRSYWIRVGPNPMTGILIRRLWTQNTGAKGEHHVKREAKNGGTYKPRNAKECQGLPVTTRS